MPPPLSRKVHIELDPRRQKLSKMVLAHKSAFPGAPFHAPDHSRRPATSDAPLNARPPHTCQSDRYPEPFRSASAASPFQRFRHNFHEPRIGRFLSGPTNGMGKPPSSRNGRSISGASLSPRSPSGGTAHTYKMPQLRQPWRELWPFTPGSPLYAELKSKHPEVLSWQFDGGNRFDHPWQAWKGKPVGPWVNNDMDSAYTSRMRYDLAGIDAVLPPRRGAHRPRKRVALDALELAGLPVIRPRNFNYLAPLPLYDVERPYLMQLPPIESFPRENIRMQSYPVDIHEISGHEHRFTLNEAGFEFTRCLVPLVSWSDDSVKADYIPAMEEWLTRHLQCDSVFVYSYNFRHHGKDEAFVPIKRQWDASCHMHEPLSQPMTNDGVVGDDEVDNNFTMNRWAQGDGPYHAIHSVRAQPNGPCRWKPPFQRVHCDASEKTHLHLLSLHVPEKKKEKLKKRIRLLSVWRPLSAPIQDIPLALCDSRTVDRDDLVPMDIVYPHFVDEVYEVKHNPRHRWYYKKGMQLDEAIILKLDDTLKTGATVCPHSAFVDHTVPLNTPRRSSIEVKVMVFG